MLERTPYCNDHLSFERENYFRYRQILKQQGISAEAFARYPRQKPNVYNDHFTVHANVWPIPEYLAYNSYAAVSQSQFQSGYTRMRSASTSGSAAGANININDKQGVCQPIKRNCRRVKYKTSAFGRLHAEHARKFYQSNESQSYEHSNPLIQPYHQDVQFARQWPVSYQTCNPIFFEQGRHLRKPLCQQQRPLSRDPEYVKSEPRTTIFKMATISPRPSKQSEKGNPSFKVGFTKCTSKDIKDGKLLNKKLEKELACSPIFQILGELSRDD